MGLFSSLFGYRWSIYIRNDGALTYALHQNSIFRLLGYVLTDFSEKGNPTAPWDILINCNKNDQWIKLDKSHFLDNGQGVNRSLLNQIETIDPGYRVKGAEPVFIEVRTKTELSLTEFYNVKRNIFK